MLSRGTYEITSREEGKVVQRDASYRSCVLTMVIFILLCVVLILASMPWKKFRSLDPPHYRQGDEDSIESARIEGDGFTTTGGEATGTTEMEKTTRNYVPTEGYSDYKTTEIHATGTTVETTREIAGTTSKVGESTFEVEETTLKAKETTLTDQEKTKHIVETSGSIVNAHKQISTTLATFFDPETATTARITTGDLSTSFVANETSGSKFRDEESSTATTTVITEVVEVLNGNSSAHESAKLLASNEDSTTSSMTTERTAEDYTSLQKLLVAKYFGNESTTTSSKTEEWLDEMDDEREHTELSSTSARRFVSTTLVIQPTAEVTMTATETVENIGTTPQVSTTTAREPRVIDVCDTGSCKQSASKMLSYMNHSSDPCDDFYEYACGGLQADSQINEKILLHRVYETIEIQARKQKHSKQSQLLEYYESCLNYEMNFDTEYRINLARESLTRIGKFYTRENWPGEFRSFTALFASMLLQNRPVLFDIVPDIDERNPNAFTLRIGPAVDDNPFRTLHAPDPCMDENLENLKDHVNLGRLYEFYTKCRKDSELIVIALTKALKDLGIFGEHKNSLNQTRYLEDTVTNIYHEIIEGVQTYFPSASKIREAYRSKQYNVATLEELQHTSTLLNWTQLVQSLTGFTVQSYTEVQVYYKEELTRTLKRLEIFARRNERELNNALLGLYARNLYRDLVAARSTKDLEKKCFNIAAHFMQAEASTLYLSSFAESEIQDMQNLMRRAFHELRETLRTELKKSQWAVEWGREVLLKKIDDMRMSVPSISNANNEHSYKINITDNYFKNSMTLMKKYRSTMYSALQKNPSDPEQIWTFFANPYQSNPQTIYGLNLIVVPFGAIDWPFLRGHTEQLDYASLATVGNLVAREIAHNFDTNGIRYWNGTRDSEFALMTDDDLTKTNFEDYINCQKVSIYQEPVEMSLPITGQRLTFDVPLLTLNERLSDAVGMRLVHDTLVRLGKDSAEKRLPWLDLDASQLYYLAYAQTHCTKAFLTSSYVQLYEDPELPSRIRIFVAASNNKNLGESWNCPEGSQLLPTFTCGVFPHLEYRGVMPDPA